MSRTEHTPAAVVVGRCGRRGARRLGGLFVIASAMAITIAVAVARGSTHGREWWASGLLCCQHVDTITTGVLFCLLWLLLNPHRRGCADHPFF